MELTEEEIQIILDKRKKEEPEKPEKVGYLKVNLYYRDCRQIEDNWLYTESGKDEAVQEFADSFDQIGTIGDEFDCYLDANGNEEWYDQNDGYCNGMDAEWAKTHLRKIKKVKS